MAALNFPTSPSNGDVYSGYSYDSSKSAWTLLSNLPDINSRFYISETAPSNPTNGEIWLNSADGNTYIYYGDGDTSQWIEIGGKTASPSNLADLGDVTLASEAEGQTLVYNGSGWENGDAGGLEDTFLFMGA